MWTLQLLNRLAECRLDLLPFVTRLSRKDTTHIAVALAGLLLAPSVLRPADQTIQVVAVTNSADFQPGLPQKGSLASIFCTGLQGGPGVITAPSQPPLPTEITVAGSSVSVWVNFVQAPILAIAFEQGYQQINVQVPWEAPQNPLFVQVFQGSNMGYLVDPNPWVDFPFGDTATFKWSVFFINADGYAVVQHASDYSLVTKQNPAHAGEFLTAYGISLGPVGNPPASGYPAPANPTITSQVPTGAACRMTDGVSIGAAIATPTYVGLAPGAVGVYQVNFQLPANLSPGDQQLAMARTFLISPFGLCLSSGTNEVSETYTSRSALLPVQ
jgi:uncharacterized protein (TIGR03437 family)